MAKTEIPDPPGDLASATAVPRDSRDCSNPSVADEATATTEDTEQRVGGRLGRIVAFILLPSLVVLLAAAAGFMFYRDHTASASDVARGESVRAATESTVALLSYQSDTADKTLDDARGRLTGAFRDSYSKLIHEVVIPGAKQKHISSLATVPAASSVSANSQHAVVLAFVNQSIIVGSDAPTASTSCVQVTLDKVGDHWLISQFDPI